MKRTVAIILVALIALGMTACAKTTETKSENQITIFADVALEEALTEVAKIYTDSEKNENAPADANVLFSFKPTETLSAGLTDGDYCDIFIPAGSEALEGRELAGPAVLTITGTAPDGGEAVSYPAAILNMSDRSDAASAFLDYLKGDDAGAILARYGFSIG